LQEGPITTSTVSTNPGSPNLATSWNDLLHTANGHFLQSWEWGEFKQRHGWQAERILVEGDAGTAQAQVLFRGRFGVTAGYVPRGPAFDGDPARLWPLLRDEIDRTGRARRAAMTLVEPNGPMGLTSSFRQAGVALVPGHQQPGRTVKVPLGTDDEILGQMKQKTRYNVRLAQRRGVVVEARGIDAVDEFYTLMQDTSDRNEFGIHSIEYYRDFLNVMGDRAVLLFASVDGGVVATTLMAVRFGHEAIYMYGASSTENRANGAAFLLQFTAMQWARDHGCDTYDLWGIPAHDPVSTPGSTGAEGTRGDDWHGLHRFKTGFGGQIVTYPPMFERRHVPVLPAIVRRVYPVAG
jgi:lipid II:glycine glycyltransferase (peptidoglycan interpeptide bridge formation enzyme)